MTKLTLPADSNERKNVPVLSGCLNYAPAALAWFARISVKGDRKHNPENAGNPPFHARGKSMDHGDCIVRHTMDIEDLKAAIRRDGSGGLHPSPVVVQQLLEEAAYRFWRAGVELQELCEKYEGAPLAPAARLPDNQVSVFAANVMDQYKAMLASGGGLVAGCAAAKPYELPALTSAPPKERAKVDAMLQRIRDTDTALEVGDQIGQYGNDR